MPYLWLADLVLLLHFAVVVFVILGLVFVVIGNLHGWAWVNGLRFRLVHVAIIGMVVFQAWLGQVCSLTVLESWLRGQAGESGYQASFMEHWVHGILYYQAPFWVFATAYTVFALLVGLAWWYWPPKRLVRHQNSLKT